MAPGEQEDRRASASLTEAERAKAAEVMEREGVETELMEHDESETGEHIADADDLRRADSQQ